MTNFHNILFDLDGTLTDPKIGITSSVQYSLKKFGIIEPELEKLTVFIGPPLWESYKCYYGFNEEITNLAVKYYREYYSDKGIFENEIYNGIKELLVKLNDEKFSVYIATSKPTIYAKQIADYFEISNLFRSIEGSELDGKLSNKVELIKHILGKHNLNKDETIMVGDRKHDIIGAKENRIKSIGVGYGYGSQKELEDSNANYYVNSVNELSELLLRKSV
jgi:phosphoglycolate phosphatase